MPGLTVAHNTIFPSTLNSYANLQEIQFPHVDISHAIKSIYSSNSYRSPTELVLHKVNQVKLNSNKI